MAKRGKAVLCREWNKPVVVEEVEFASPAANQVLVKVEACGVCHSDLSATNGTMPLPPPLVLGHEACGSIVEVGPGVSDWAVGDKVVACWIPSCGHCDFCAQGKAVMCVDWGKSFFGPKDGTRPVKDASGNPLNLFSGVGVMAEYAVLHRDSLIRVPKEIASDKAALVGCGVMTGVGAVFNRAQVKPGSTCLVIGAGGVGLNVIQGCAIAGAEKVIAVDLSDKKLEFAAQFGATHTLNPNRDGDPVAKAKELTGGAGVDYAFEVIGLGATIAQAYNAVRKGGMAVVIGVSKITETVTLPTAMMPFDEKVLTGSVYGSGQPKLDIPRLIQLYRKGSLKLDELVTSTYRIDDAARAFDDLDQGVNARGVIVM
jgi:S-(hydroxymethyl)glutathione dehydrogenase/alcohol dehydrogenase